MLYTKQLHKICEYTLLFAYCTKNYANVILALNESFFVRTWIIIFNNNTSLHASFYAE